MASCILGHHHYYNSVYWKTSWQTGGPTLLCLLGNQAANWWTPLKLCLLGGKVANWWTPPKLCLQGGKAATYGPRLFCLLGNEVANWWDDTVVFTG